MIKQKPDIASSAGYILGASAAFLIAGTPSYVLTVAAFHFWGQWDWFAACVLGLVAYSVAIKMALWAGGQTKRRASDFDIRDNGDAITDIALRHSPLVRIRRNLGVWEVIAYVNDSPDRLVVSLSQADARIIERPEGAA